MALHHASVKADAPEARPVDDPSADPSSRYLNEITFVPKVIFITIGGMAVLYYSLAERLWTVKAGEEAPMSAKWVAALVLVSWTGVIMGGRLLAYL